MSGATAPRTRRRRALAAALRRVAAQEGVAETQALETRVRAIAESQGVILPPEADLPENLARLERGATLPPELAPVLAALLLPFFSLRPDPRSIDR
jgi:type III secretion system FlhB-like substrate exporter